MIPAPMGCENFFGLGGDRSAETELGQQRRGRGDGTARLTTLIQNRFDTDPPKCSELRTQKWRGFLCTNHLKLEELMDEVASTSNSISFERFHVLSEVEEEQQRVLDAVRPYDPEARVWPASQSIGPMLQVNNRDGAMWAMLTITEIKENSFKFSAKR